MIGENENINSWEKNLSGAIENESNIEMQKTAWVGKNPDIISSFSEVIEMLYGEGTPSLHLNSRYNKIISLLDSEFDLDLYCLPNK